MHTPKYSTNMEIASLTFGIIAVVSCICLYTAIPCASLAIIFGVLSRGGQMRFNQKAISGIILGAIGLAFTLLLYGTSFAYALYEYGSIEGILKAYADMTGMDYNELLNQLTTSGY